MLETLEGILISYPVIAPVVFIIARISPIVFAPIPGIALDFLGIAILVGGMNFSLQNLLLWWEQQLLST